MECYRVVQKPKKDNARFYDKQQTYVAMNKCAS